jgi:membrane-associated protease RseP (regulator of RpoE activity)
LSFPVDDPARQSGWPPDDNVLARAPFQTIHFPPPRPKFQHRWWLHSLLLAVTLLTTTAAGALHYLAYTSDFGRHPVAVSWGSLVDGLWYSITIISILGAHEMGHYLACRRYNVDATLPFFIPAPILTGTFGAVIRIREPFPTRTALFDIGVAGPLAGFAVIIPAFFFGLTMSPIVYIPKNIPLDSLGEPLLFKAGVWMLFGQVPNGYGLNIHPVVFASWFGMLATALNLLPFGQLDGGHLAYATLRRWSMHVSFATVATALALTYNSWSWLFMTGMMLVMLLLFGARHPRVLYEYEPLPASRYVIAVVALIVFIICFTPVPLEPFIRR